MRPDNPGRCTVTGGSVGGSTGDDPPTAYPTPIDVVVMISGTVGGVEIGAGNPPGAPVPAVPPVAPEPDDELELAAPDADPAVVDEPDALDVVAPNGEDTVTLVGCDPAPLADITPIANVSAHHSTRARRTAGDPATSAPSRVTGPSAMAQTGHSWNHDKTDYAHVVTTGHLGLTRTIGPQVLSHDPDICCTTNVRFRCQPE